MENAQSKTPTAKRVPLLSIIIPSYKPNEIALAQNLGMINAQINLDFGAIEVLVVDDATPKDEALPVSFFQNFKNLLIHVLRCTVNGGPGVARQIGINYAQGRYVMFADADDSFYDVSVISQMIGALESQEISGTPVDILVSDWTEELKTSESVATVDGAKMLRPNHFAYTKHENDGTWMHGKIYRRAFLTENDIKFDDLRVHEDRRFNAIALSLSQRTLRIPIVSYVWKFNPSSITRAQDAAYSYNSIAESVDAADRAYEELTVKHADRMDLTDFNEHPNDQGRHKFNPSQGIVQTIYYTYFVVQSWVGRIPDTNALKDIEHRLGLFYIKYKDIYSAYPVGLGYADYATERNAVIKQMGPFIEKETLPVFLWRIEAVAHASKAPVVTASAGGVK